MFYKIGFFVLLAVLIAAGCLFIRSNPMKNQGAAGWTEFYSAAPQETMTFMSDVFGIKHEKFKEQTNEGLDYYSLKADGQFWSFAGVMAQPTMPDGTKVPPSTMVYLTVKDYDAVHEKMIEHGARAHSTGIYAAGMKFGIYEIPGGLVIGVAQYGVKK